MKAQVRREPGERLDTSGMAEKPPASSYNGNLAGANVLHFRSGHLRQHAWMLCCLGAVYATEPSEVPGMNCPEIGRFAQQFGEEKANGAPLDDAVRRLRQSIRPADTERALEDIIRAIYGMQVFSTATPDEIWGRL
jgi:hypothetical protein